ncbi:MAG: hypothetical protein OEY51_10860, partial [Cyclobacteriaceae bacterium]|nr:hypothetical protein [Cyclobacteriaceae bacterium]
MKKRIFYIALSFILTLAVTEYIWHSYISKERIAIEIETGAEQELNEEIPEGKNLDVKTFFTGGDFNGIFNIFTNGIAFAIHSKCRGVCKP